MPVHDPHSVQVCRPFALEGAAHCHHSLQSIALKITAMNMAYPFSVQTCFSHSRVFAKLRLRQPVDNALGWLAFALVVRIVRDTHFCYTAICCHAVALVGDGICIPAGRDSWDEKQTCSHRDDGIQRFLAAQKPGTVERRAATRPVTQLLVVGQDDFE
jgi:hypothetical protein